jgi:hypothetical protein
MTLDLIEWLLKFQKAEKLIFKEIENSRRSVTLKVNESQSISYKPIYLVNDSYTFQNYNLKDVRSGGS